MSSLDLARTSVMRHEGCRLHPYDDATGRRVSKGDVIKGCLTIGWGLNLDAGLTQEECDWLRDRRLLVAGRAARRFVSPTCWRQLDFTRRAVLIEMAYNLGEAGLHSLTSLRAALEAGDYVHAATRMRSFLWARQVGKRAETLASLMQFGGPSVTVAT
jgi:lysozyme